MALVDGATGNVTLITYWLLLKPVPVTLTPGFNPTMLTTSLTIIVADNRPPLTYVPTALVVPCTLIVRPKSVISLMVPYTRPANPSIY